MKSSTSLKLLAFLSLLLALAFWGFFQYSKHTLGDVNPFGDDPYDAVGSFGSQVSLLAALLALLRALRPYPAPEVPSGPVLRACGLAVLSTAVTLAADGVALARYPSVWSGSTAGLLLAVLTGGLALLTILAGGMVFLAGRGREPASANGSLWGLAAAVCAAATLLLALYPADWRTGIAGALFTAVTGMLLSFLATWALLRAVFPRAQNAADDVLDDLAAVYASLKTHAGPAQGLFAWPEKLAGARRLRPVLAWLNPRRHAWNFVLAAALLAGSALMLVEALGEGLAPQLSTVLLVAAVFIGIEAAGVLIGYGLLGGPLGLFRRE